MSGRADIWQWLRRNNIIEVDEKDVELTAEHGPAAGSHDQPLQNDQREASSVQEAIPDAQQQEEPVLVHEYPSSANGGGQPSRSCHEHDSFEARGDDDQHEHAELPSAQLGNGDEQNGDAEVSDEQGPSSSSSTQSSSDMEAESDECPLQDRVDNHRSAAKDDRRQVYMWTYSRAPEMSREDVATIITNAYASAGVRILHYSVFREQHPSSRSERERQFHFHIIVESDERHRWRAIARFLRNENHPMHCSAAGSGRSVYWAAFSYCYVPSSKKPREHLDSLYFLSRGHPDILQRLLKDRRPKRVKPLELGNLLREQDIRSVDAFYAFAKRQANAGDDRWLNVAYGTQARRLQEQIAAVWAVETADRRLKDLVWFNFSEMCCVV